MSPTVRKNFIELEFQLVEGLNFPKIGFICFSSGISHKWNWIVLQSYSIHDQSAEENQVPPSDLCYYVCQLLALVYVCMSVYAAFYRT